MKRKKILPFAILIAVMVLALVYAIGQGKKFEPSGGNDPKKEIETNNVDEIGTPTNDDPWKEMEKLVNAYYPKQGVTYHGTMKLIDDNGNNEKILEEKKFEYSLLNEDYHYSIGSIEVINKKSYIIAIDHENKSIALSPHQAGNTKPGFFNIDEFKKLIEERKASAKVTQLGNQKILTIDHIEDPTIQGYSIYYLPETYKVQKMLIGMVRLSPVENEDENDTDENDSDKNTIESKKDISEQLPDTTDTGIEGYYYYLEINYTNVKLLSLKEIEFNPENKFLTITKDKVELTPAYSSYELNTSIPVANKMDE